MKKVLIIRIGAIGDVVHTTNLYRAIKNKYPDVTIHYLTGEIIKPLLESDKDISKVITTPKKFKLFSRETKKLIEELKQEKYDIVFNLQPSLKTRIISILAGIKKRINYKKDFKIHAVTNFWQTGLKVFDKLNAPKDIKLYLSETALNLAKKRTEVLKRPIIVLNAGGIFSKRQGRTYPIEKWIELGNKIQENYNGTIILNGAKEDREFLLPMETIKNSINYIGELSLEDSCALILQADLMISGDSGPLHIATALGVKSIGLYGSMPVKRTGCYCNGINIVSSKHCVPCNRRKCKYIKGRNKIYTPCMEEISVENIFDKIQSYL